MNNFINIFIITYSLLATNSFALKPIETQKPQKLVKDEIKKVEKFSSANKKTLSDKLSVAKSPTQKITANKNAKKANNTIPPKIAKNKVAKNKQVAGKIQQQNVKQKVKAKKTKPTKNKASDSRQYKIITKIAEGVIEENISNKIVTVRADENYISLVFPWEKKVAAAAFTRGQYFWVIFNGKKDIDIKDLETKFNDVKIIPDEKNTIIIFKHFLSGEAKTYMDGKNNWHIDFAKREKMFLMPYKTINEYLNPSSKGVFFAVQSPALSIQVTDPIIGDNITVIPIYNSNAGVSIARNFVDFDLLKTSQGMALVNKSDEIKTEIHKHGVDIIAPNYVADLHMAERVIKRSKKMLEDQLIASPPSLENMKSLLPYLDGINYHPDDYTEDLARLRRKIYSAPKAKMNLNRLNLARFYFKHELYIEALAILDIIDASDPRFIFSHIQAAMMRGVSHIMAENYYKAEKIFDRLLRNKDLPSYFIDEIKLWRNYGLWLDGQKIPEIGFIKNADRFIFAYPNKVRWQITIAELESLIDQNKLDDAKYIANNLIIPPHSLYNRAYNNMLLLKGRLYSRLQDFELAKMYLEELRNTIDDPFNRVRAEIELVTLKRSTKELTYDEAIKRLDRMKIVWRSDNLEKKLGLYMAELYAENNQLVEAMREYNYVIKNFYGSSYNIELTSKMIKIFNSIFTPGGFSEVLDDFYVISLFNEFRELTPIGAVGDDIVISIARKFINLDLLEMAESLLDHQVKFRLKGEKKVTIASNLALVYLMNNKPQKAIDILNNTDRDNYTYKEHLQRLRIKTKAFIKLNDYKSAFALLKNDHHIEANLLREEAYFKQGAWLKLIDLLEDRFMLKIEKNQMLYDLDSEDIVKLAIAYVLGKQQDKLEYLNNNLRTANENAQKIISYLAENYDKVDFRNLEKTTAIQSFTQFLEMYKKKLF